MAATNYNIAYSNQPNVIKLEMSAFDQSLQMDSANHITQYIAVSQSHNILLSANHIT